MTGTSQKMDGARIALTFHTRTKHRLERFAPGPETLDWDTQPNPFREFSGSPRIPLAVKAEGFRGSFAGIYQPETVTPASLSLDSIGILLELSMGLSAWKEYGPDRWALRCNPSSGNLHPTETYILAHQIDGLDDGVFHYQSRDHALEQRYRAVAADSSAAGPRLWIGLSSIHWREAWKYGERAFRYCQLDIGHALGSLRYAAGALGWAATLVDIGSARLAGLLGLDRTSDFARAEAEDPDLLLAIDPAPGTGGFDRTQTPLDIWKTEAGDWFGQANLLDAHPMYRWPIIDEVSAATEGNIARRQHIPPSYPALTGHPEGQSAAIILNRRSAQRFNSKYTMASGVFYRLLDSLLARPIAPWDIWDHPPSLHPVFFVHRVEGVPPGVYAMPRTPEAETMLRQSFSPEFLWTKLEGTPEHLPLFLLVSKDCRSIARTISCHQGIAGESCFALSMLSDFTPTVAADPRSYRQLHWEAGLLGHVLYLEAEAAGLRGTGIGCYFDDVLHELLGLKSDRFQALYHFTVGNPHTDTRILTLPAYPGRHDVSREEPAS